MEQCRTHRIGYSTVPFLRHQQPMCGLCPLQCLHCINLIHQQHAIHHRNKRCKQRQCRYIPQHASSTLPIGTMFTVGMRTLYCITTSALSMCLSLRMVLLKRQRWHSNNNTPSLAYGTSMNYHNPPSNHICNP